MNATSREIIEETKNVKPKEEIKTMEVPINGICERLQPLVSKTVNVSTSTSLSEDLDKEEKVKIVGDISVLDRTVNNCGEPLRLVQRSEVTLRVNAMTSDAASQTETTTTAIAPSPPPTTATSIVRHQLQEEIECDQLSRDFASQLSPTHRLQGILGKNF